MKKKITDIWKFLTYDIWRITEDEVTRTKFSLYNIIKTIYLCINRFTKDRMANKASALTYSTFARHCTDTCHPVCRGTRFWIRQSDGTSVPQWFRRKYRNNRGHSLICQLLSFTNQRRYFHWSWFGHVVMDGYQSGQQY